MTSIEFVGDIFVLSGIVVLFGVALNFIAQRTVSRLAFSILLVGFFLLAAGVGFLTNPRAKTPILSKHENRVFYIVTQAIGSGTVIQTATNAASFMGPGIVRITSSPGENLLGERAVLMSTGIEAGQFVSVNRVLIRNGNEDMFRFTVAERPTNRVDSSSAK